MKRTVTVLLALLLLLTGCSAASATLDLSNVKTDPDRFVWGSFSDVDVSLGDVGLFYPLENTLRFYDMDAQEEYILCPRANCRHNTDECIAYFKPNLVGKSAEGVAQIDQYIYCFYYGISIEDYADSIPRSVQLIRIDLNKGIRETVASFPSAMIVGEGETDETFYADGMIDINYCNGWAWLTLDMKQSYGMDEQLSYYQITGIELSTGRTVALNGYDDYQYSIVMITPQRIYYRALRDTVAQLSEQEWFEQFGDAPGTIDGVHFDDYNAYWSWHATNIPEEYCHFAYDIQTGETILLNRSETVSDGEYMTRLWRLQGEWEGRILISELQPNESGSYSDDRVSYFLLDPETGEKEWIEAMEDGQTLNIADNANRIFPDGNHFYVRYTDDGRADIFTYNFITGEETFLFNDDAGITIRIYGEYKDGYFGKHKDHQYLGGYYWISKKDFFAGNLDAMVHYDAGGKETPWN